MDERIKVFSELQKTLKISDEKDIDILKTNISLLKFFKKINSSISYDLNAMNNTYKLRIICKTILRTFDDPKVIKNVLVIKKPVVRMSEIKEEFKNKKDSIHSIDICSYSIYFDRSVTFSGKNLCIQTRYVHAHKARKVDLKGEKGKEHDIKRAEDGIEYGNAGYDGKPGNPGKPGGSFYLNFKQGTAQKKLTIDVSGGDGGEGQYGGHGHKGKPGKDAN